MGACIHGVPEYLSNIDVPGKLSLHTKVQEALVRLHTALGEHVDINLRYSGTESKLRLKIRAGAAYSRRRQNEKRKPL